MAYAPRFSMSDFSNWFANQNNADFFEVQEQADPANKFVGHEAQAKMSRRKLLEAIECPSCDEHELVEDFCNNGGSITDVKGKNLCIEVASGSFEMPRFCVKVLK